MLALFLLNISLYMYYSHPLRSISCLLQYVLPNQQGYNINLLIIGQQISENPLEVIVAAIYIVCALNINNNLSNLLECVTVLYNAA